MTVSPTATSAQEPIVSRAREGDQNAFEALYRTHCGRVFGVCLRMARDQDEAESWAQEAWVKAWERIGSFRGESSFATWLHRLTVNLILDRKRRQTRRQRLLGRPEAWAFFEVVAARCSDDDRVDLERAVSRLPTGARTAFILHDVEGYTHQEIADRLDVAEGTIKAQLHRARRLLREALR